MRLAVFLVLDDLDNWGIRFKKRYLLLKVDFVFWTILEVLDVNAIKKRHNAWQEGIQLNE